MIVTTVVFGATMTILKKALLKQSHKSEPASSSIDNENSYGILNQYLEVREPMLNRQKSNSQSFAASYSENKFSTSFMEGMFFGETLETKRGK